MNDWSKELFSFDNNGLKVANFTEIRRALIEQFKSIYGTDINISNTNADGIFINNISLIFNNILQSFANFYSQININTATGIYLDRLCSLGGTYRLGKSKSSARLIVANTGTTSITGSLQFVDDNGDLWLWSNINSETIAPGESLEVIAYADEYGPIAAKAGSINKLIDATISASVTQEEDASLGSNQETDEELRDRRKQNKVVGCSSVLESLYAQLYAFSAVEDVYIYNNNASTSATMSDGATIQGHDVYVVIRKRDNLNIADRDLANTIYNYITPGIRAWTSSSNISYGTLHEFDVPVSGIGSTQDVSWKQCIPVEGEDIGTGGLTIVVKAKPRFSSQSLPDIAKTVADYMNNLTISEIVDLKSETSPDLDLMQLLRDMDPTFTISSISDFSGTTNSAMTLNTLTYFKFKGNYTLSSHTTDTYTIKVF